MLDQEFDIENIRSVNFGVRLIDDGQYFIPVDIGVQSALGDMLKATAQGFAQVGGDWEQFSVSEDYGNQRLVFAAREDDLMVELSALYDVGDLPDAVNLHQLMPAIDYYFGVFRDVQDRKVVAVRKANQFKGTLRARNRLIRIADNSLQLIADDVLRLDLEFDVIVANERIYIRKILPFEYLANIVSRVSGAARDKVRFIEEQVTFLDLSGIAEKIDDHARTARLAASIAARDDLDQFQRGYIEQMAAAQGVKFVKTVDGRLRPRMLDGHKLLEILDDRRYLSGLTGGEPAPFRAPARQRVIPGR